MKYAPRLAISALVLTSLTATTAHAQVSRPINYSVVHTFRFEPAGDVVQVTGADFRHAWIQTPGIFGSVWSAQALPQDPLFDPFGTDSMSGGSAGFPVAFNSGLGVPVQCVYNSFVIPPAGINSFLCIILPLDESFADACTEFFVRPFGTTAPFVIEGSVASSGGVLPRNGNCYAYSSAAVSARGGVAMGNGTIQWSPTIHSEVVDGGLGAPMGFTDPVYFVANNLDDGTHIEASLFNYTFDSEGTGMVRWENDLFETDHKDFEFILDIPQPHVLPDESGSIRLRVESGIVTISDDTGIYDGVLPPLGDIGPFVFLLPNNTTLNYNLGLNPDNNWDVTADFSGGGGVNAANFCPADLDNNGELDIFDVLLFIDFFNEGDPRADFTGDKQFDIFDMLGFLDAFNAGCDSVIGKG